METKMFEIRDRGTFIPALAVKVAGADGYLLRRAGFGANPMVILIKLNGMKCRYSADHWSSGARTMPIAHKHIKENWPDLKSGAVIDVEYILGERETMKQSEAITHPEFRECLENR